MTGTVGNLRFVPYMATDYGQAAILTPSDYFFARDGIAAEGTINQEQIIVADVELDLLDEQRVNGNVIPLQDLIKDACDNVVHFSDYKAQQLVETEIYEFSQYIKDNLGDNWCCVLLVVGGDCGRPGERYLRSVRHSAAVGNTLSGAHTRQPAGRWRTVDRN